MTARVPDDPHWPHKRITVRLTVIDGSRWACVPTRRWTEGAGRSNGAIGRWTAEGLMPERRYRTPGRSRCVQSRRWTREADLETVVVVSEVDLSARRAQHWKGPSQLLRFTAAYCWEKRLRVTQAPFALLDGAS